MMTTTHDYHGFVFTITYRVEEPGSDLLIWGPGGLRGVRVICLQR